MAFHRPIAATTLSLILTSGCVYLITGCGSANEAVQTEVMEKHLKEVKQNYGKQNAEMFRGKAAQKKKAARITKSNVGIPGKTLR